MVRDARDAPYHEASQILPETSFCTRFAISISRFHARSRNDIMRSMSRSLGSGISILRSPSATFGSGFFSEFGFRQRFVDLAGDDRLARRQFGLQPFIVGLQPADFRIQRRAFVGHGVAGPARAAIAAGRNRAGPGIEPDHAVGRPATAYNGPSRCPASTARRRRRFQPSQRPGRQSPRWPRLLWKTSRAMSLCSWDRSTSKPIDRRYPQALILHLRAIGRAAGFQRVGQQFDPVLSPEYLAVEHIDRRSEHVGRQRILAVLLIDRADLVGSRTLDQLLAGKSRIRRPV